MRPTRGLLGTLGTSLTLIGAGACTLLVFSALIAFHGWPGSPAADFRQLAVTVGPPATGTAAGAAAPALVVAPAAASAAVAPPGAAPRRTGAPTRGANGVTHAGPSGATPPQASGPSAAAPSPRSGSGSPPGPQTQANPVQQVVGTIHQTLPAPGGAVGGAVNGVGQAVDGTVQGTTQTLTNAVGTLTQH